MESVSRSEFGEWPPSQVAAHVADKVVVFAPGGTSRWYFLEHAKGAAGYSSEEQFRDYSQRALRRAVELSSMMLDDGIKTVFLVGFVPGQDQRTEDYNRNVAGALGMLVDKAACDLYDEFNVAVRFRGAWDSVLQRLGRDDVIAQKAAIEARHPDQDRWLIWLTVENDEVVPTDLEGWVLQYVAEHGHWPTRREMCAAYYGREMEQVDILVGHNKPSVGGLVPPLMVGGDVYFTVNPSYYLSHTQWREILWDYLFARRGHFRNYERMGVDAIDDLRSYYEIVGGKTLGVGERHEPTQTWRPKS